MVGPIANNTPAPATGWNSTRTPPPPPPPRADPAPVDKFERVQVTRTPAQQQQAFEANIGDVARKIDGKVGFARNQGEVKFNEDFWVKTPNGMEPKPGVKASDAMADYVKNPGKYSLDCAMDSKMLHAAAANQTLGPEKFNEATAKNGGLDISFGEYKGLNKALIGDNALREKAGEDPKKMPAQSMPGDKDGWAYKNEKPGDAVYFHNPDVTPAGRQGGFRGENAVYIGNNERGEHLYFAHGMKPGQSIMTEKEIADLLAPHSSTGFVTRMDEISRPNVNRL